MIAVAPEREAPAVLDRRALQDRGYTEKEAYALLRRHGVRVPSGRRARIALSILERIERGEVPA